MLQGTPPHASLPQVSVHTSRARPMVTSSGAQSPANATNGARPPKPEEQRSRFGRQLMSDEPDAPDYEEKSCWYACYALDGGQNVSAWTPKVSNLNPMQKGQQPRTLIPNGPKTSFPP